MKRLKGTLRTQEPEPEEDHNHAERERGERGSGHHDDAGKARYRRFNGKHFHLHWKSVITPRIIRCVEAVRIPSSAMFVSQAPSAARVCHRESRASFRL